MKKEMAEELERGLLASGTRKVEIQRPVRADGGEFSEEEEKEDEGG